MKDIDICLLELSEDVIESGRVNNIPLKTICLPEQESLPGSSCFTSGINRDSKIIDAVALNLFNHTFCDEHSTYNNFGTTLNENQLCAGIPSNTNFIAPFNGKYEQDFGGPLICLDPATKQPIFTGITSTNSLSTTTGEPGSIQKFTNFSAFCLSCIIHVIVRESNKGFTPTYLKINSGFKTERQLGHNGRNVLDHVFPLDEESVQKTMDAMDWNMKWTNVRMQMIRASDNSPIFYQKVIIHQE